MHYPQQVLLGFAYSRGTLVFIDLVRGIVICQPYSNFFFLLQLKSRQYNSVVGRDTKKLKLSIVMRTCNEGFMFPDDTENLFNIKLHFIFEE